MEDISTSRASAADLPGVQALLRRCQLPVADLTDRHLDHFIVCRSNDRIVGTVGLELLGGVALLRSLAVAPEQRGQRLAHGLWARCREHARAHGVERLYLLTTTAEPLFARWGFRRIPREETVAAVRATTEFTTMCPSSAAVMAIDLPRE